MQDCEDGAGYVTGTDEVMFIDSLKAHVPQVGDRPLAKSRLPSTAAVLDILDFVALHIDQPSRRVFHRYFGHEHLFFDYDQQWITPGEAQFRADVDLIFARNGIAFSFGDDCASAALDRRKPVGSSRTSGRRPAIRNSTPSSWTQCPGSSHVSLLTARMLLRSSGMLSSG
jgi:hypothetical protein